MALAAGLRYWVYREGIDMPLILGASIDYGTFATSTASASQALPSACSVVTCQNLDGTNAVHIRFGTSGDSATTSDFRLSAGEEWTFFFNQAGQHGYIHYISSAGTPNLVVLVDNSSNA